jgi:hypothetical protein
MQGGGVKIAAAAAAALLAAKAGARAQPAASSDELHAVLYKPFISCPAASSAIMHTACKNQHLYALPLMNLHTFLAIAATAAAIGLQERCRWLAEGAAPNVQMQSDTLTALCRSICRKTHRHWQYPYSIR